MFQTFVAELLNSCLQMFGSIVSSLSIGAPCDIFAAGGNPCVAAHSTVRALYSGFDGNLYQVKRLGDNATVEIGLSTKGGIAKASTQDAFCKGSGVQCVIQRIYDQSGRNNHLDIAPPGGAHRQMDAPTNATIDPTKVSTGGRM